jgi:hypothetical protein
MARFQDSIQHLFEVLKAGQSHELHAAYDDCLWAIATSGKADIEKFVLQAWQEPYSEIPVPLLVIMCRLYVLESKERTPEVELAINFISAHCSPAEENGALGNFVRQNISP